MSAKWVDASRIGEGVDDGPTTLSYYGTHHERQSPGLNDCMKAVHDEMDVLPAKFHGIYLKNNVTASSCITLEEYKRRLAAEKEEDEKRRTGA